MPSVTSMAWIIALRPLGWIGHHFKKRSFVYVNSVWMVNEKDFVLVWAAIFSENQRLAGQAQKAAQRPILRKNVS